MSEQRCCPNRDDFDLRRTELCCDHFDTSYTGEDEQHCIICAMQERIAELEAAQRWIAVSERLPEKDGRYLAFFCMRRCALSFRDGRWRYDSEYMSDERQKDITHWQPLPAHPQEPVK